ncbi:MAG: hypothetical protein KDA89_15045, partial [Planctomycetaceae bacterium]|nr:hypothetical protein [Planctomycetaceae bacterium]
MRNVYCPGCNELFSAATDRCPRCGMIPSGTMDVGTDTVLLPLDAVPTDASTEIQLDNLLLDGQQIDIYECLRMLGRGGMGVVY